MTKAKQSVWKLAVRIYDRGFLGRNNKVLSVKN